MVATGDPALQYSAVECLTFLADRGHHFTVDHTEQLDQEEHNQMEPD